MDLNEQQEEELEAMNAIFEDDECYKTNEVEGNLAFQYRFNADNETHSFILGMVCPKSYPEVVPEFSLDLFFNNHIMPSVKTEIIEKLNEFCDTLVGDAMIYSVVDFVKENHDDLMTNQNMVYQEESEDKPEEKEQQTKAAKPVKKEQLTKSQKRKMADRVNIAGERQRGWNWIDPIKHLSQTGKQGTDES